MNLACIGLLETLASEYRRDVSLTRVARQGAWRAECAGLIAQSIVGPEEALLELGDAMAAAGLSRRSTEVVRLNKDG